MSTPVAVALSTLGPNVGFQTVQSSPASNPIVWITCDVYWKPNSNIRTCINLNDRSYQDLNSATMVLPVTQPNLLR